HVRAGRGKLGWPDEVVRRAWGNGVGESERELVEEVRVRCGQVKGDRVCLVVGDDPSRQVTVGGCSHALAGADDAGIKACRAGEVVEAEDPFDGVTEVFWPDRCPVGVPEAGAEMESVGRTVIDRRR